MEKLREKGVSFNKSQINNFLVRLRNEKYGATKINLGEVEKWCQEHSFIPEFEYEPYIVSYYVSFGDDDENEKENDNSYKFGVFISTKCLLKLATYTDNIHADATYKLIWEGMPVLIVGNTDFDRHFHPFGLCVTTNEDTNDFKFMFQSILNGVEKLGRIIGIKKLISYASDAIRNAFIQVFSKNNILIMCWAHMRRNVNNHLHLVDELYRQQIMDDVKMFHSLRNSF